jgi:hypothetical protein
LEADASIYGLAKSQVADYLISDETGKDIQQGSEILVHLYEWRKYLLTFLLIILPFEDQKQEYKNPKNLIFIFALLQNIAYLLIISSLSLSKEILVFFQLQCLIHSILTFEEIQRTYSSILNTIRAKQKYSNQ